MCSDKDSELLQPGGKRGALEHIAREACNVEAAPPRAQEARSVTPSPEALAAKYAKIDEHVNKCLSMVLHHEEVVIIADVIKRILRDSRMDTQIT